MLAEDFLGVKAVPGIRRREGDDLRHLLNLGPWPRTSVESAGSPVLLGAPSPGPSALAGALAGSGGKCAVFVGGGVGGGVVFLYQARPSKGCQLPGPTPLSLAGWRSPVTCCCASRLEGLVPRKQATVPPRALQERPPEGPLSEPGKASASCFRLMDGVQLVTSPCAWRAG